MSLKRKDVLVFILIVICIFFYLDKSCTSGKELQQAIGAYDQLKKTTEANYAVAAKERAETEEEKKQLQEENIILIKNIQARDEEDVGKEEELEELEVEEPELEDKDVLDHPLVVNLKKQNAILRTQLGTALFTIGEIGKPIITLSPTTGKEVVSYPEGSVTYNLDQKYLKQVDITNTWIKAFNEEHTLRIGSEDVATKAIKNASRIRLGSDIKTAGVVVLGGYIVYSIFFKK